MTTTPFSPDYENHIKAVYVYKMSSITSDADVARMIISAAQNDPAIKNENHDFDQVFQRVKAIRAFQAGPGGPGNSSSGAPANPGSGPPGPGDGTGSPGGGGWRQTWSQFTSRFSPANWANTAQSAMGSFMSRARAATWMVGRPGIGQGVRRRFGKWARTAQSLMGNAMNRMRSATWVVGRGGGGRSWFGNGIGSFGSSMKQAWGNWRAQGRDNIDPWLLQQFLPSQHGFFGRAGGATGYVAGALFGGPGGGAAGQAVGTILGNFTEKLKDAVVQARDFAIALKESNRRFIYYNASIAMSYVESDFAEMRRNFSIARAIAPNAVSLNQQLMTYQQTIMPWDILGMRLSYETKGAALGMAQNIAELGSPVINTLNSLLTNLSPKGDLGYNLTRSSQLGSIFAMAYNSIPFVGPLLGVLVDWMVAKAGDAPKGAAGVKNGDPIGPWEKLMDNPNAVLPRNAQFNQNPGLIQLRRGMRL